MDICIAIQQTKRYFATFYLIYVMQTETAAITFFYFTLTLSNEIQKDLFRPEVYANLYRNTSFNNRINLD